MRIKLFFLNIYSSDTLHLTDLLLALLFYFIDLLFIYLFDLLNFLFAFELALVYFFSQLLYLRATEEILVLELIIFGH